MAGTKKPKKVSKPLGNISKHAAQIFAECAYATGQGIEREMAASAGGRPYGLEPKARDFWLASHTKSIPLGVKKSPNGWPLERDIVLARAMDLGRFAAMFALADPANAAARKVLVSKQNVKDASAKVRKDPHCIAARRPSGGGVYCAD